MRLPSCPLCGSAAWRIEPGVLCTCLTCGAGVPMRSAPSGVQA